MILVDTGPLVGLFDPRDATHAACRRVARVVREEMVTTLPVLTETAHLLGPASPGFRQLVEVVASGDLAVDFLSPLALDRTFELMDEYRDQEMDLADASLVAVAEVRGTSKIWTLDATDFGIYRLRRGHRLERFEIVS